MIPFPNAAFDVVAIVASAGGIAAAQKILSGLPVAFPAAVLIVQHLHPYQRSSVAKVLSWHANLPVKEAEDGELLRPGTVYLAPPNSQLLVHPEGTLSLSNADPVRFVRSSADVFLESVAASFKDRAMAVVLTGSGTDGAAGVRAVKRLGGTVIAQDERTSEVFGMPRAAIQTGSVDFILPLEEIPLALVTLVMKEGKG